MKVPVLETKRLILRPLTVADAQDEFEWLSDPAVTKFMPYNTYTSIADVEAWLRSVEAEEEEYHFGFVRKSDGKLIGAGSIGPNAGGVVWEFGYNIRRDCWNQGYATEATRAMIAFARDQKGATMFGANHAVDNPASGRVMEKCGLIFDHYGEYSSFDGLRTYKAKCYLTPNAASDNDPILRTDRLILRPLTPVDAPYVYVWVSDERVTRYLPYTRYTRVQDAIEWLRSIPNEIDAFYFGITRRTDHLLIGSASLTWRSDSQAWEIGYNLRHDCWGQGYATETTRAMINFGKTTLGAKSFVAKHAVNNPASGHVLEKCGLKFDHYGEYTSLDGLRKFNAKFYSLNISPE